MIELNESVANIVLSHSECGPVFQKHRIDFCCKGQMSLEEASKERGIDPNALLEELKAAVSSRQGAPASDPRSLSTAALIAHIITKHHEYLREALPFVVPLAAKVGRVHGGKKPQLQDLAAVVQELSDALLPHLDTEEESLFPALMSKSPDADIVKKEFDDMQKDHLEVADMLSRMRDATENFQLPVWACNSYKALFSELEKMEGDILNHVHLENHVLMPRFQ